MHEKRIYLIAAIIALVLLPLSVSCSRQEQPESRDRLVIYTYDAFPESLEKSITEHMKSKYGVTAVITRYEDTGGLYTQLYLEREKPAADVAIGLDETYLTDALKNEMFTAYKPNGFSPKSESLVPDGSYRLVPFDYGNVVLNYNSDLLKNPPESWTALTDPGYREKIILLNPATSSPGRNFLLLTIAKFGETGYLDFWKKLKPNVLTVTAGWSEGYGLYTEGEAPIVVSYDTSPAYHIEYENERKFKNLILEGDAYAQIELAGIIAGTKSLANARRLMDYIVSKEFQSLIPLGQIMYPIRPDVELPDSFREAGTTDTFLNLDAGHVGRNFQKWLAEWEAVMRS